MRNNGSGLGLCSILGIVFVVLKLLGYVEWSWWWVTLPFWGPPALVIVIAFLIVRSKG